MKIETATTLILAAIQLLDAGTILDEPVKEFVKHFKADHPPAAVPGLWRKKTLWKPRFVKEWRSSKTWKPVWRKILGPIEVHEWIPIPKPPPGWSYNSEGAKSHDPKQEYPIKTVEYHSTSPIWKLQHSGTVTWPYPKPDESYVSEHHEEHPVVHEEHPVIHDEHPVVHEEHTVVHEEHPIVHDEHPVAHTEHPVHEEQPVFHEEHSEDHTSFPPLDNHHTKPTYTESATENVGYSYQKPLGKQTYQHTSSDYKTHSADPETRGHYITEKPDLEMSRLLEPPIPDPTYYRNLLKTDNRFSVGRVSPTQSTPLFRSIDSIYFTTSTPEENSSPSPKPEVKISLLESSTTIPYQNEVSPYAVKLAQAVILDSFRNKTEISLGEKASQITTAIFKGFDDSKDTISRSSTENQDKVFIVTPVPTKKSEVV